MASVPKPTTDLSGMFPRTLAKLNEYGERLREAYRQNITESRHPTTRDTLRSTAEYDVSVNGYTFRVELLLQEYWKWVENDTRPHWPPRSAIEEWVRIKPIVPKADSRGRVPSVKSLAFLISRKIARVGTTGTHDLSRAAESTNGMLSQIGEEVAADITEHFTELLTLLRKK